MFAEIGIHQHKVKNVYQAIVIDICALGCVCPKLSCHQRGVRNVNRTIAVRITANERERGQMHRLLAFDLNGRMFGCQITAPRCFDRVLSGWETQTEGTAAWHSDGHTRICFDGNLVRARVALQRNLALCNPDFGSQRCRWQRGNGRSWSRG